MVMDAGAGGQSVVSELEVIQAGKNRQLVECFRVSTAGVESQI